MPNHLVSTTLTILLVAASASITLAGETPEAMPTAAAHGALGQLDTDAWITTKVKAELKATAGIASSDIGVGTTNGTVTLVGVLESKDQIQQAIAVAKAVNGVGSVDSSALVSRR